MWFGKWSEGNRQNLLNAIRKRDPDSYLDEVIIAFHVLILLAFLVTASFGVAFHYNIFLSASGKAVSGIVMSLLFFIAIEICKIFFGMHFVRSLLNGVWWKSLYHLIFTIGLGVLVAGAFLWSIRISTKGVAAINETLHKGQIFNDQQFQIPSYISDLDAQIAALEGVKSTGQKSTWRGRPTKEGLDIIQSNTDLQKSLIDQRSLLMEQALARHDSVQAVMKMEVMTTSSTLLEWGGKAEYATMIFIVLLVVAQNIYYDNLKKKGDIPTDEPGKK